MPMVQQGYVLHPNVAASATLGEKTNVFNRNAVASFPSKIAKQAHPRCG